MSASRDSVAIIPALLPVQGTNVLTSDNTNNANNETVTIAGVVYTFKTTLTGAANEILIGADADASLTNLAAAINGSAGAGTTYGTGTVQNPTVSSSTVSAHAITLTARTGLSTNNTVGTTEAAAHLSFATATLTGGSGGATTSIVLKKATAFNSEPFEVGSYVELIAFLSTIAQAGTTPTLDVKFQFSHDKKVWVDSGDAFTQVTTSLSLTFKRLTANFGKYMRVVITLGGTTPEYTFDLSIMAKG